ncbi:MAG: PilZ domain-containing protein [Gemmataceae bacterium]|nr:PilZ domain-containing protein [Gemmataceae bacterium]
MIASLFANFTPEFDWIAMAAGLAASLVAVFVGVRLSRRGATAIPVVRHPRPTMPANDPFRYGSATERRESYRRKGARVRVELADAEGGNELGSAWVVDRSAGGLCLLSTTELPAGVIFSVRPVHAPNGTPWARAEVKSCREADGEWEIGCKFVRQPSWSMMLLFG